MSAIQTLLWMAVAAGVIALILANSVGIEEIETYEKCVEEKTGMTPTQYYQVTGQEPTCE